MSKTIESKAIAITSTSNAVEVLLGAHRDMVAATMKQSDRYVLVLQYMDEENISLQAIRESFQTIKGSDWPQVERTIKDKKCKVYLGQVQAAAGVPAKPAIKANKAKGIKAEKAVPAIPASEYAKAYNRFRASVSGKYQFEEIKDGDDKEDFIIMDDDNQPVAKVKEPAERAPRQKSADKNSDVLQLGSGPALWEVVLTDIMETLAKERTQITGDRKAKRAKLAAIQAKIELAEELYEELELDLIANS